MSAPIDLADLIRTRFMTAPAEGELTVQQDITAVPVIVDRQKNIQSEITKAVAKARGSAITILWDQFDIFDDAAEEPPLNLSYRIMLYSKPIISGDDLLADDVLVSMIRRLWHWRPNGEGSVHYEAKIRPGGIVPDKTFLIYDFDVEFLKTI
jgi:hypothetical protein